MWWSKSKVSNMPSTDNDIDNLVQITNADEQERHPRAILETSPSVISSESGNFPREFIDVLDDIYTCRAHRRCIDISLLTLFSMTFGVVFWVCYWLTYNRCENLKPPQSNSFLCQVVLIFEVLTISFICISPFLFLLMIYSWIRYSCHNPFDPIRGNFIKIKLEGTQWKDQLDYYYKQKFQLFHCFRRKQRNELYDRGYGFVFLSPHGIVMDELILLTARQNLIDHGILLSLNEKKILKLVFKGKCQKFWKKNIWIYLPDELTKIREMEKLMVLLKINIDINTILPPCF